MFVQYDTDDVNRCTYGKTDYCGFCRAVLLLLAKQTYEHYDVTDIQRRAQRRHKTLKTEDISRIFEEVNLVSVQYLQ
jgi:hypothetical protein